MRVFHAASVLAVVAAAACPPAAAEITTQYGINFARIGAPGNRDTLPHEVPDRPDMRVGGVAYEYRLSQTEITTRQWLPFVEAYAPHIQGNPGLSAFTSLNIVLSGGKYQVLPGTEDWPVTMSWRIAARYANWLHNNQSGEAWAFESGAYDTSTFGTGPQGFVTDQRHHSPGARFWIPTLDEWYKGVYYDPDRNGPGEGGYWLHPGSSDEPLVSGLPGTPGSQTNAGWGVPPGQFGMPAGQYPRVESPWQLLDTSGGTWEMSEDFDGESLGWDPAHRYLFGSRYREVSYESRDRLDGSPGFVGPDASWGGVRLAADVPTAPGAGILLLSPVLFNRRTRQ